MRFLQFLKKNVQYMTVDLACSMLLLKTSLIVLIYSGSRSNSAFYLGKPAALRCVLLTLSGLLLMLLLLLSIAQ
jgi:hypothetical protein